MLKTTGPRKVDNANRTKLQRALGTEDVACVIDAKHLCVNSRGLVISKVVP
jgi:GTP cyclohydrolase I